MQQFKANTKYWTQPRKYGFFENNVWYAVLLQIGTT